MPKSGRGGIIGCSVQLFSLAQYIRPVAQGREVNPWALPIDLILFSLLLLNVLADLLIECRGFLHWQ